MSVQIIHSMEEFQKAITDTKFKATVVDFTATWCGPCKMISPIFESYSKVYPTVKFIKVDVDENDEITASAEVSAMPTFQVSILCFNFFF